MRLAITENVGCFTGHFPRKLSARERKGAVPTKYWTEKREE